MVGVAGESKNTRFMTRVVNPTRIRKRHTMDMDNHDEQVLCGKGLLLLPAAHGLLMVVVQAE
jgi:hypothetical protein